MAVKLSMIHNIVDALGEQLEKLEIFKEEKENVFANEDDKEYPNQERLDILEDQMEKLSDSVEQLDNVIEILRGYE